MRVEMSKADVDGLRGETVGELWMQLRILGMPILPSLEEHVRRFFSRRAKNSRSQPEAALLRLGLFFNRINPCSLCCTEPHVNSHPG